MAGFWRLRGCFLGGLGNLFLGLRGCSEALRGCIFSSQTPPAGSALFLGDFLATSALPNPPRRGCPERRGRSSGRGKRERGEEKKERRGGQQGKGEGKREERPQQPESGAALGGRRWASGGHREPGAESGARTGLGRGSGVAAEPPGPGRCSPAAARTEPGPARAWPSHGGGGRDGGSAALLRR